MACYSWDTGVAFSLRSERDSWLRLFLEDFRLRGGVKFGQKLFVRTPEHEARSAEVGLRIEAWRGEQGFTTAEQAGGTIEGVTKCIWPRASECHIEIRRRYFHDE